MQATIRDRYLETEVTTATPQRLRLMLIDEALRQGRNALEAVAQGSLEAARLSTTRCRNLVSELLAGIQPDQTTVAKDVLRLYLFLYSTLMEVEFGSDFGRLRDIVRVLGEEQSTWQAVCQQLPELPEKDKAAVSKEELAPAHVRQTFAAGYGPAVAAAHPALSVEA